MPNSRQGIVYTETVVHAAPERFAAEAPYQIAIIGIDDDSRITARIEGERVAVGDRVVETEPRNAVPFFRKVA